MATIFIILNELHQHKVFWVFVHCKDGSQITFKAFVLIYFLGLRIFSPMCPIKVNHFNNPSHQRESKLFSISFSHTRSTIMPMFCRSDLKLLIMTCVVSTLTNWRDWIQWLFKETWDGINPFICLLIVVYFEILRRP